MIRFLSMIITFFIVILITVVNYQNKTDFSLIFYKFKDISGILLLYIGMIVGIIITLPIAFTYSKKYAKHILQKNITQETKRLKKEEKRQKKEKKAKKTAPIIT